MKKNDVDVHPPKGIRINPNCTTCGGEENPHAGMVLQGKKWIPCPECVEYSEHHQEEEEGDEDE